METKATENEVQPPSRWVFLDKIMLGLLFSWIALVAFLFYLRLGAAFFT